MLYPFYMLALMPTTPTTED